MKPLLDKINFESENNTALVIVAPATDGLESVLTSRPRSFLNISRPEVYYVG